MKKSVASKYDPPPITISVPPASTNQFKTSVIIDLTSSDTEEEVNKYKVESTIVQSEVVTLDDSIEILDDYYTTDTSNKRKNRPSDDDPHNLKSKRICIDSNMNSSTIGESIFAFKVELFISLY